MWRELSKHCFHFARKCFFLNSALKIIIFRALTDVYNNPSITLLLSGNDMRSVLATIIKAMIHKNPSSSGVQENYSSPVISAGKIAWVKFEFESQTSIEESCCFKTKTLHVTVDKKFFIFHSEVDFRMELRKIEQKK